MFYKYFAIAQNCWVNLYIQMTDIKYSLGLPDSLNPQIVQTLFYTTKNTSIYKPKTTKLTGGGGNESTTYSTVFTNWFLIH